MIGQYICTYMVQLIQLSTKFSNLAFTVQEGDHILPKDKLRQALCLDSCTSSEINFLLQLVSQDGYPAFICFLYIYLSYLFISWKECMYYAL